MSKLDEILQHKRMEVDIAKKQINEDSSSKVAIGGRRDFISALKSKIDNNEVAVIGELKKASPSAGQLKNDYDPVVLAKQYEKGGVACLSVLTDSHYFQGHLDHLVKARQATNLPVLRKDFIIDPYQVDESAAMGADAILLIAAAFESPENLEALLERAISKGMAILLEIHTATELAKYAYLASWDEVLIGINNRDLSTFKVDIKNTLSLVHDVLRVSRNPVITESGITTPEQVQRLRSAGISGFLVGTALMQASDPLVALQTLFGKMSTSVTL